MIKRYFLLLLIFFSVIPISCSSDDNPYPTDASFFGKIWDSEKFCAFTDLVEYNNIYYCCFRESDGHLPSLPQNYGKIRIISSIDGLKWSTAALIEDPQYDLRDPKMEITSDGHLMLLVGVSSFDDKNTLIFRKTRVSFSSGDLSELSNFTDVIQGSNGMYNNYWLWRAVWHNGKAYGVSYKGNKKPVLLESADGINYKEIVQFDNLEYYTSEAGISFTPSGEMCIVIRSNVSNGFIAYSQYPYTNWEWHPLGTLTAAPILLSIDNNIFGAARGVNGTIMFQAVQLEKSVHVLSTMPQSSGDYGYPGILHTRGEIWVSSYDGGNISLMKIPISKIFKNPNFNANK